MNLKYPLLRDEAYLHEELVVKGRWAADVAKEIGCTPARLSQVLRKLGFSESRKDKYIGNKFGMLTPQKIVGKYNSSNRYECLCECGQKTIVIGYSLLDAKRGVIKNCGCLLRSRGRRRPRYQGFEGITKGFWSKIMFNAETRGIILEITIQDAWQLFISQDMRCAYTGMKLVLPADSYAARSKNGYSASLDRINPEFGYVAGNIQWVHKTVNMMKSSMTHEEFKLWVRVIARGISSETGDVVEIDKSKLDDLETNIKSCRGEHKKFRPAWLYRNSRT